MKTLSPPLLSFPRTSIRRQLLLWLLLPIITLGLVGSLITYLMSIDFANDAYDDALAESARALASRLFFDSNQRWVADLPSAARAILKEDREGKFFYQVRSPRGRLLAGRESFPAAPPAEQNLSFRNGVIEGEKVRIAALKVSDVDAEGVVTVQVAETYDARNALTANILTGVMLLQLILIVLVTGSVWLGVTHGMRPLERVREAVSRRSIRDLRPLDEADAPQEVRPLVQAINGMMNRLANDMEVQRRFMANAAHQLRTPLAGLKTQTELALRLEDAEEIHHALQQILTSAGRTTHLSEQLLSLARVEPGTGEEVEKFHPLDLATLARESIKTLVPQALAKQIDLGYEGGTGEALITGDPLTLEELICNLLENAIRYTDTGGRVTLRVVCEADTVSLVVEDNGPGIPAEERHLVFERFYRVLGTGVDGSGLGLSIVQEIAHRHKANIRLEAGPEGIGTSVKVSFPASFSQDEGVSSASSLAELSSTKRSSI
jgi:two-component system sensor histidine kinase TctE